MMAAAQTGATVSRARALRQALAVVTAALALRGLYAVAMYLVMGDYGLMGEDSVGYYDTAKAFAGKVAAGSVGGWQWLGLNPLMFPLFNGLLATCVLAAGAYGALAYVLCQGLIDAGTCLVVFAIARAIDPRFAVPAAVAAAVNPTQIVVSGLVYPDTPFVLFIALALLGAILWLRAPSWRAALLVGASLGAAALFRVLVSFFVPALLGYLLVVATIRQGLRARAVAQVAAAGVVFALCIGVVALRNATQYGAWALTPQTGTHLANWVVPLIMQAQDGTPWQVGHDEMERRTRERFGPPAANPFQDSRFYAEIAREQLRAFGLAALAKAWAYGAVINLGSPAIILSPPVLRLPRTGFYATPGATMIDKMGNFLFHSDNTLYGWILLIGVAGTGAVRLLQLAGLIAIARQARNVAPLLLLAGWCAYILLINGPVAQPKYRLPIEPVLCVLSGAGWHLARRRQHGHGVVDQAAAPAT